MPGRGKGQGKRSGEGRVNGGPVDPAVGQGRAG